MSEALPIVYLARHGETAWTITGQHTGLTDLPLTERGERNARQLGERLRGVTFAKVTDSGVRPALLHPHRCASDAGPKDEARTTIARGGCDREARWRANHSQTNCGPG
jgi:Histidine phosphatase superfamily (branch 1)